MYSFSFEGVLAQKRACVVLTFQTVYSALHMRIKTSRPHPTLPKKRFLHGVTANLS